MKVIRFENVKEVYLSFKGRFLLLDKTITSYYIYGICEEGWLVKEFHS